MDGLNIEHLQGLQSKDQLALLDAVDELRRHGVSRYISLPQIIVCGDQSSGKSSVLEAISGVQFPVDDGLCTRFTTEVILRRASNNLATVKLIPSKDATPAHKEKLSGFNKSSISHTEIPSLISEAKTIMGLAGSSTFSRDVLQLEVSGPKLPHLTLVDLPGLIHNPNKEQTKDDVQIPKELVKKYMSGERSIVLAIVTAKNDTANQVILEMAKKADTQGVRTMGIITKPDCLISDSPNEVSFFDLASNKEIYFKLDWHVLRNGDYNERKDPSFDRDEVEKEFFSSGIWRNLPESKRGVEALRTKLSHALYQQIQKELPSLLEEIRKELQACKKTLDRLGSPRDTTGSQRAYLSKIANLFHELVRQGTDGSYQNEFFRSEDFESSDTENAEYYYTRLRANVRKEEQKFLQKMEFTGHTYQIGNNAWISNDHGNNLPVPKYITEKDFLRKIQVHLDKSRGKELPGTFPPSMIGDVFVIQSKKWIAIAHEFVENVWHLARQFLNDVLAHVADETVRQAVLDEILDPAMDERLLKLRDKVEEVHSPYKGGYPATLNRRFERDLEKRRQNVERVAEEPQKKKPSHSPDFGDAFTCLQVLHLMQSYYGIALETFVDNVASLAVENCLMSGLKDLLSAQTVSEMNDDILEAIAFETQEVRQLRSQTLEKQSSLQRSLDLFPRQYRRASSRPANPSRPSSRQLVVDDGRKKHNLPRRLRSSSPLPPTLTINSQFGFGNNTNLSTSMFGLENVVKQKPSAAFSHVPPTSGSVPVFGMSTFGSNSFGNSGFGSSSNTSQSYFDSVKDDYAHSPASSHFTRESQGKDDESPL